MHVSPMPSGGAPAPTPATGAAAHLLFHRRLVAPLVAAALLVSACATDPEGAGPEEAIPEIVMDPIEAARAPQAVSLFGDPLYALEDTTGAVVEADQALAEAPEDLELLIAAARVRRNFWQYRQEMALYTRAMELAPDDWRLFRFRGHRFISVREFDAAIRDLERARELAPMNWDVAYHLGLAYYLAARFQDAANEYLRCLELADDEGAGAAQDPGFRSCSQNREDPESLVAMTEWAVRAALRAGMEGVAAELLERIPVGLELQENVAYYHDLLFYKGLLTANELLNPGPDAPYRMETVGYGVANWFLVQGDTAGAVALLEELVQDDWWPGFGRIAAEVELARLTGPR
jgi:tetratricopeptide (TPR) repeat protein